MIRRAGHPLWWAAPLRLVRSPGWFALVLLTMTLVVGSVVAPLLFVGTARSTALTDGLAATAGSGYGKGGSGDLRVTWTAPLSNRAEADVLDRLSALTAYDDPTLTAAGTAQGISKRAVAMADGREAPAVLWYHDGAVADLGGKPVADGVWLSSTTAADLGLTVGDTFRLGIADTFFGNGRTLAPVVLAGTYETAPGSTLPQVLADRPGAERWFLPIDPVRPSVPAPMAIVDHATFDRLARRVGAKPLYLADMRLDPEVGPAAAHVAVAQTRAISDDAFDGASDLYADLASGRPAPAEASVIAGLPEIVQAADVTATSAREQVGPYAVGGEVLATVLLVAAWVLLGLSRRREQLLGAGLGMRPVELAALGALELLPACLVAVPAGVALAHLGVAAAGPATASPAPVSSDELVRAAVAAGAALLLLAATTGLAAFATDRADRLSVLGGRQALPWGVALLAGTAVVTAAVVTVDVGRRSSTPLTTLFPLLVAASVAMLVITGVGRLRSRVRTRARPGTARWLAARRSGPVVREVAALAAVVAVALGLFAYTITVRRGIDEGVADKTAALSGAATTVVVADDLRGQGNDRAVAPPVADSTVVWSRGVTLPPVFGEVPVLAVDSSTFAAVADWGGSGELDAGRAMLPRLARPAKGLPMILAGDTRLTAGDQAVLGFTSEAIIPAQVVGVVDAFPGSERETGTVTVVVDSHRLFRLLGREPPVIDPRVKGAASDDAGAFTSTVWSSRSLPELRDQLAAAHLTTDGAVTTAAQDRIDNGLVASTWAAAYVVALGAVTLLLALAAGLVLVLRLSDRDTVSDVVLRRMGYGAGDLARARSWEVGYAVATGLLAAVVAAGVLVLGPVTIDATAGIPPLARPRPAVADAAALLAVLVGLVLVSWPLGTLVARRRSAAKVLRAGD